MSNMYRVRQLYRHICPLGKAAGLWAVDGCSSSPTIPRSQRANLRALHSLAAETVQFQGQGSSRAGDTESHADNSINYEVSTQHNRPVTPVPWYIRHQPSITHPSQFSGERHAMPEISQNSPPILEPLMQHLSIELGLDSISLLDLRNLNPPPALGANLLMIFGSARSEKHLHVSADKLCRWLRATYQLKPVADGLLGRNELKLKLKRKARRSKLLRAAGAELTEELDDGIQTEWICIDTGTVDDNGLDTADIQSTESDLIGFRTHSKRAKIVIQVMTESKREEADLESLWGNIKRRQQLEHESQNLESIP